MPSVGPRQRDFDCKRFRAIAGADQHAVAIGPQRWSTRRVDVETVRPLDGLHRPKNGTSGRGGQLAPSLRTHLDQDAARGCGQRPEQLPINARTDRTTAYRDSRIDQPFDQLLEPLGIHQVGSTHAVADVHNGTRIA